MLTLLFALSCHQGLLGLLSNDEVNIMASRIISRYSHSLLGRSRRMRRLVPFQLVAGGSSVEEVGRVHE